MIFIQITDDYLVYQRFSQTFNNER